MKGDTTTTKKDYRGGGVDSVVNGRIVASRAPLGPKEVPPMHISRWVLRIRSQLARSPSSNPHRRLSPPRIKHGRDSPWSSVRAQRHGFWSARRRPSRKIHSEPCFVGWGGCFFLGGVPREQKESPPTVLYRRHDFFFLSFWSLKKTRCPPTGIPSFGT